MGLFIGREKELSLLNRIYYEENVKTCVIYGRRRIGKTELLRQFSIDKKTLFVQFVESSEKANTEIIRDEIEKLTGSDFKIENLHQALEAIKNICNNEKTLIVFDEAPYILKDNKTVASEMQHMVDYIKTRTDSMVVFCGSSISLMIEEIMDKKSPLYGRFAFILDLGPLSLQETRGFHPSVSDEDLLRIYLTLGGVAAYHELVGDSDYKTVLNRYVLNQNSIMNNDIPYDIKQELGASADDAFSVLESISSGYNIYKQIAGRTGLNDNKLSSCIRKLTDIHVIKKMDSIPVARKSSIYVITDRLTSFHFTMQRYSGITRSNVDAYENLKPMISSHLGKEFEEYCRNLIVTNYPCIDVGSWWGPIAIRDDYGSIIKNTDGKPKTEDVDIDVAAIIRRGQEKIILFGECKFTNKVLGFTTLNTLRERIDTMRGDYNERLALFSLSGFDEDLAEYAEDNGIMLFDLDTLVGKKACPEIP